MFAPLAHAILGTHPVYGASLVQHRTNWEAATVLFTNKYTIHTIFLFVYFVIFIHLNRMLCTQVKRCWSICNILSHFSLNPALWIAENLVDFTSSLQLSDKQKILQFNVAKNKPSWNILLSLIGCQSMYLLL